MNAQDPDQSWFKCWIPSRDETYDDGRRYRALTHAHAAELHAETVCRVDVEYQDHCVSVADGGMEERTFEVTVTSRPLFYARRIALDGANT